MHTMYNMDKDLLDAIDTIVWSDEPDAGKLLAIQNLLYQRGQIQDHRTEQMFGDDDAHVESPNMRRI